MSGRAAVAAPDEETQDEVTQDEVTQFALLSPRDMIPWPELNPRREFDEAKLQELADSVRAHGVLEPILVSPIKGGTYWIVAGERRWRASVDLGLTAVPCLVRKYTLGQALDIAIVENAQRDDLSPIEEARGFRRWLDGSDEPGKVKALAERIGKSQPYVSNRIRLLELPESILARLEAGQLPIGAVRDYLLPFLGLGEPWRARFFDAIEQEILEVIEADTEIAEEEPGAVDRVGSFSAAELLDMVQEIGGEQSTPLNSEIWMHERRCWVTLAQAQHEANCGCGAPAFRWTLHQQRRSVRCFNEEWVKQAADELAAEQTALREQSRAQPPSPAEAPQGEAAVQHYESRSDLCEVHGYMVTRLPDPGEKGGGLILDPAKLAGATFATVGDDRTVYCLTHDAVESAKISATRAVNRRLERARRELQEEFLAEALATSEATPDMLRWMLDRGWDRMETCAAARTMDISLSNFARREEFDRIPDAQLLPLFRLIQLRRESGAWLNYQNPVKERIEGELRKEYAADTAALIDRVRAGPGDEDAEALEHSKDAEPVAEAVAS